MAYSWAAPLVVVPGDPVVVAQLAQRFSLTAESIGSAASSLRSLDASSARSEAVDAFVSKAADLESRLSAARGRYADTGSALRGYSESLAAALDGSRPAVRDHERARDDFDAADRLATRYEALTIIEPPGPGRDQYEEWAAAQQTRRDEARDRIAECARRVAAAHAAAGAAAVVAISQIDDATDDGLRDSFWDDLGGGLHAVGTVVGDVGDGIAAAWEDSALRDVLAPGFESFQEWMQENDAWIGQIVDVLEGVGFFIGVLGFFVPGLGAVAGAFLVASLAITALRTAAGTATLLDLGLSALSVATMGTGAALVRSAGVGVKSLQSTRVASLVAEGQAPGLAAKWVQWSFDRAAPGIGSPRLWQSLGDDAAAQIRGFLAPGRPGASAFESWAVRAIERRLDGARILAITNQARAIGEPVSRFVERESIFPPGGLRVETSAPW
jgi:hypothetical protein